MDGYYYNKPCYENKDYSSFYFFYPNGFFIGGLHDAPNKSLEIMDAYIDTVFHYRENRKNTVQDRGAFIVENNTVKIQFFACYYHCEVEDKKMRILNDSTFVFNEPVDKKEYKNYPYPNFCDTFHFRKLNWKPDSTYQIGFEKQLKKGRQ